MPNANNTNYSKTSKTINSKFILGKHTNKILAKYQFGYSLINTNIKSNIKGFNIKYFLCYEDFNIV